MTSSKSSRWIFPRRMARFAAVQALFQHMQRPEQPLEAIVQEFLTDRFTPEKTYALFDTEPHPLDEPHFLALVHGVKAHEAEIDACLAKVLSRPIPHLEPCTLCILRCATFEISHLNSIPTAVILDEYITLAHGFLLEKGPTFINGVLDAVAQQLRPRA